MPRHKNSRPRKPFFPLTADYLVQAIKDHGDSDECLIWPYGKNHYGYGTVRWEGKTMRANRVAFFVAHGRWPIPMARHTCDIFACFNPNHLIEGTNADNGKDAAERGRCRRGEQHHAAKLTEEIVRQILSETGISHEKMAVKYNIGRRTIDRIFRGERWHHVVEAFKDH